MPYKRSAKYYHRRQRHPSEFKKSSFRTVPISHTKYRGKKYAKPGVQAVVGKHKPSGEWKIQSILQPKGWVGEPRRHALAAKGIKSSGVPPIHYGASDMDYSPYEMARQQVANEGICRGDSDYEMAIASRMEALEDQYQQSRDAYVCQARVLAGTLASGLPWDKVADEAAMLHQTAYLHGEKYGDPIARDVSGVAHNIIRVSQGDRPSIAGRTRHVELEEGEREALARQLGRTIGGYIS